MEKNLNRGNISSEDLKSVIKERYSKIAEHDNQSGCCSSSCCSSNE